jgi:hypothetical protein
MNAERAAGRVQPERHNLRLKLKNNKKKASSCKPQATSYKLQATSYKRLKRAIIKK